MLDPRIRDLAFIFIGGGAGAVVRVLMDVPEFGPWMPANFLACFLMGLSSSALIEGWIPNRAAGWWKALVHTGFLGGLSTFSVLSIAACIRADGSIFQASLRLLLLLAAFFLMSVVGYLIPKCFHRHG